MAKLWWTEDRATVPPVYELIRTENRNVSINLGASLASGESILAGSVSVSLLTWREGHAVDPLALSAALSYNATSKVATQKIDASKLPDEPVKMIVSFTATGAFGPETRSVFVVLVRVA